MTDFFTRLAEQALGRAPEVQPLVASRFAPGRPLVGEAFSGSSEEPEADGDAEGSHAFSERATLIDSPSPGPMPAVVSKEGTSSDHLVDSGSKKEDHGPVSSSSNNAISATRPDSWKRTTHDATSVRRRRAGSDRREPIETVPTENGIRPENLGTFPPITPVVRTKDLPAREHSTGDFPSLSKSSVAETHGRSLLREARDQIASSELPSPPPTIRVTIGRIEVRAIMPPSPPTRAKPVRPGPTLSLEDYLKQRNKGQK
jgi:hypothetical protein